MDDGMASVVYYTKYPHSSFVDGSLVAASSKILFIVFVSTAV
jgi:hypothetical protein